MGKDVGQSVVELKDGAVLREAQPGDEAGIHALIQALADYEHESDAVKASPDDLTRVLFGPSPTVFGLVVEKGEATDARIVAIALWFLNYSTWTGRNGIYLEDLIVAEPERSNGYGKALLTRLAQLAVERGYSRFEWSVLDWNEPSIGFYRSLGAFPMDEWTVYRLTGDALTALGTNG